MSETYVKLNTQLLIQKNLESLEKVQQSVAKTLEPYNQMTKLMSSYAEQALVINKTLSPTFTKLIEMQQLCNEITQPLIETLNIQTQMLNPIFESIANTLNNLDIAQNPAILQEPASNLFDQEFLEECSHSFGALRNEVTVPIVNEELEAICDKPTKKLTVGNIYYLFNVYLVIIGVITGTKELYEIFTETDTPQVTEYNSTEQNKFEIDELNININICPSLSSNQNNNELDGDENRTNSETND